MEFLAQQLSISTSALLSEWDGGISGVAQVLKEAKGRLPSEFAEKTFSELWAFFRAQSEKSPEGGKHPSF